MLLILHAGKEGCKGKGRNVEIYGYIYISYRHIAILGLDLDMVDV